MKSIRTALIGVLLLLAVGVPTLAVTSLPAAAGTSCSSPVHYAASNNVLYLVAPPPGGGAWTPTLIKQVCPIAPITEVDPVNQVWELSSDLVLQNGTSLNLHGSGATVPGDVNTLRLRSLSDNLATDVSGLTLDYGNLDVDSTTITSWDDNANGGAGGPDTDPNLPAGSPSTDRGRAFIRAESYLAADGFTPEQSAMTIENSTVEYLGYYASEQYGVSYKAEGCSHTAVSVCNQVTVTGSETNSTFQFNYMGTYTWGASNMTFQGNQYLHNIMYGLDTHDVSRNFLINDNHSSYNGDHGIICSEACDHLTITNNQVDHNGLVPWTGPNPDVDVNGQVHGIMLHRGVTNSVVSGNDVHDQPNGAGIAIFDTDDETIESNTITDNLYGIRLSVGASDNIVTNNTVSDDASYIAGDSPAYGVYEYVGTDTPTFNPTGVPTGNQFVGNLFDFDKQGSNILKLTGAVGTLFSNDTFSRPNGAVAVTSGTGNSFAGDVFPANQQFTAKGATGTPGGIIVTNSTAPFKVEVDKYSREDVDGTGGQLYGVSKGTPSTTESSSGSDLALTSVLIGTGTVTVTPLPLAVVPTGGSVQATGKVSSKTDTISVKTQGAGVSLKLQASGLVPGTSYVLKRGSATVATVAANTTGTVTFNDGPLPVGTFSYSISKA